MFLVLLLYSIMNNMWLFIIHNTSISTKGLIENNAQNNIIVFTVHRFISTFIIKSKNPMVELSERFSPLFYVDGTWEVTERYVQVKTQSSCILIKFLFIQLFTLGVNYCFNTIPWRKETGNFWVDRRHRGLCACFPFLCVISSWPVSLWFHTFNKTILPKINMGVIYICVLNITLCPFADKIIYC